MDTIEIDAIMTTLMDYSHCFTEEDIINFTYPDQDNYNAVIKAIEGDSHFKWASDESSGEKLFVRLSITGILD